MAFPTDCCIGLVVLPSRDLNLSAVGKSVVLYGILVIPLGAGNADATSMNLKTVQIK